MKNNKQAGIIPLIIIAIVAIAGLIAGPKIYESMSSRGNDASSAPTTSVEIDEDVEKRTETAQASLKQTATSASVGTKPSATTTAVTKATTPAKFAPPQTEHKVASAELITTVKEAFAYGKDLICTGNLDRYAGTTHFAVTEKNFFSPRFPGIFALERTEQITIPNKGSRQEIELDINNTLQKLIYTTNTTIDPDNTAGGSYVYHQIPNYNSPPCPASYATIALDGPIVGKCIEASVSDLYFIPDVAGFASEKPFPMNSGCSSKTSGKGE
ncbi:MAG TPA: hypothetical protein VJG48_02950 [Candidatus Paceibacterota bacterium]